MNKIAELRKRNGISQSELAAQLGIAQNTLSQYENEVRKPTVRIIERIADIFGVTTNYVLGIVVDKSEHMDIALMDISKIWCLYSWEEVNLYLNAGWVLLHICNTDAAGMKFVLGWKGGAEYAPTPAFAAPGDEIIEEF